MKDLNQFEKLDLLKC